MATNNVNIINITNLPQTQDIVDGNFLVVQNDLGTQIIDWANVYVLKLDTTGSGSIIGTLSAAAIEVSNCHADSLSAEYIVTNGLVGQTYTETYANSFTFTNGVATSAYYVFGSPEYTDLLTNIIPAATSYSAGLAQAVYEYYVASNANTIVAGTSTVGITFPSLPTELAYSDFVSADCNAVYTGSVTLSGRPFVTGFYDNTGGLGAVLNIGQIATTNLPVNDFSIKVSKHYTVS
tara:strand:- start:7226 stop:7930 length:705 start_codon:yes stop_codon:yes gene_type:complete